MSQISALGQKVNEYIHQGHTAWVRELILQGFDVNEVIAHSGMALHLAAEKEHDGICRVLIEHGADVNSQNKDQNGRDSFAPLHFAARHGNVRMARMLLDAGANVNAKTSEGMTPLHLILEHGSSHPCWLTLVNEFLVRGADPNALSEKSYGLTRPGSMVAIIDRSNLFLTPLHVALYTSQYLKDARSNNDGSKAVAMLLEGGAEPSFVPPKALGNYLTPLQQAVKGAPAKDVKLLLDSPKADIGQKSLAGRSLHQLCGNRPDIKALIMSARTVSEIERSLGEPKGVASQPVRRQGGLVAL